MYTIKNMKPTRLAIKYCPEIDKKYFCKSIKECFETYHGSGAEWKTQIVGKEVQTLWVSDWFYDRNKLKRFATLFSKINKIVESNEWANKKIENGLDGGSDSSVYTEEVRQKMSAAKKKTIAERGTGWLSHPHSEESKAKMRKPKSVLAPKWECTYCKEWFRPNATTHSDSCYMNPKNYRECAYCSSPIKNSRSNTCGKSCGNKLRAKTIKEMKNE